MTQLLIPIAAPVSEDNINGLPIEIEEFSGKMPCELSANNYISSSKIDKIVVVLHATIAAPTLRPRSLYAAYYGDSLPNAAW